MKYFLVNTHFYIDDYSADSVKLIPFFDGCDFLIETIDKYSTIAKDKDSQIVEFEIIDFLKLSKYIGWFNIFTEEMAIQFSNRLKEFFNIVNWLDKEIFNNICFPDIVNEIIFAPTCRFSNIGYLYAIPELEEALIKLDPPEWYFRCACWKCEKPDVYEHNRMTMFNNEFVCQECRIIQYNEMNKDVLKNMAENNHIGLTLLIQFSPDKEVRIDASKSLKYLNLI